MKHENRVVEILAAMPSFPNEKCHKADLVPELLDLQRELVAVAYNGTHAENAQLRIWDVENHLQKMNEERGHVADDLLQDFMNGCKVICNTLKSELAGNAGEYKAFRSIETIRCKKHVLKNIEFLHGDHRTELDGIVLTEKAIFIIEVKNPTKDVLIDERGNYYRVGTKMTCDKNIGLKMNDKDYLLREALKHSGFEDPNIVSLVVFTNDSIQVENRFPYIRTCFLADLPHIIDGYEGVQLYTDSDFVLMEDAIQKAKCHECYYLPLNVTQFKHTFAELMATLEEADETIVEQPRSDNDSIGATSKNNGKKQVKPSFEIPIPRTRWNNVAVMATAVLAVPVAVTAGMLKLTGK